MAGQSPFAQEFFVIGTANPFATRWVPLENLYRGGSQNFQPNVINGQPSEYDSDAIQGYNWWNFTVTLFGEVYFREGAAQPSTEELYNQARNARTHSSMLKVELEYPMGQGKQRRYRFDIGCGIDVWVPPTHRVRARILGPDLESVPEQLPATFDRDIGFASSLVVSARCVPDSGPGRQISTFTQLVAVGDGQAALVPCEEGAVQAQILANFPLTTRVRQVFNRRDSTGVILNTTFVGDIEPTFAGPPASHQTDIVQLSGFENELFVTKGGPIDAASVIQILEF